MNVKIHTTGFTTDVKLKDYINTKLEKLKHHSENIMEVDVYLKLCSVSHSINDKIVEIKLHIPKHEFFAESSSKSFEQAFDEALDAVISQIQKHK